MALEDLVGPDKFPDALVRENPEGSDPKSQGDDHLRGVKNVIKNTLPNITGTVNSTQGQIDAASVQSPINQADIAQLQLDRLLRTELVGIVAPLPVTGALATWLECNGVLYLTADYPSLFAVLGTNYGGDGVTTFAVPDYRGMFLRGRDYGRGVNPDGDQAEGTQQAQSFLSHDHAYTDTGRIDGGAVGAGGGGDSTQHQTTATGGNETRPINNSVNFHIYAGPIGT